MPSSLPVKAEDKNQLLHRKHLEHLVWKPCPVKLKFPIYIMARAFQDYPRLPTNVHESLLPKHLPKYLLIRKDMNKFLTWLVFFSPSEKDTF